MRVLFVSGTSVGGAARSTYELASALAERGHDVATLMTDDADTASIERHKRAHNAAVKLTRNPLTRILGRAADSYRSTIGRDRRPVAGHEFPAWTCALPEHAAATVISEFRPDVVVVNSVERTAWRDIVALCAARGLPTVLYIREASGVRHLVDPPTPGDLVIANAEAHAEAARATGYACEVVPSVVETDKCLVTSDRTRVVMVNPVTIYGIDLAFDLAARSPDIPFTFVESWPLTDDERSSLQQRCATLGNAELIGYQSDPRNVYAHAKVLLMLCTVPSRPRVVLEAQANGIPVLAVDRPGHGEVVGTGGVLLDPETTIETWAETLASMWNDVPRYEALSAAATTHARRHDATPTAVVDRFEALVLPLVTARTR